MRKNRPLTAQSTPIRQATPPIWTCLIIMMAFVALTRPTLAQDKSMLLADHPLVDTLWHLPSGKQIEDKHILADAVSEADYLLLGEKHDNPRHHRLQETVLAMVGHAGKQAHVVFEMLEPRHQDILDETYRTFEMKPSECVSPAQIEKVKRESLDALASKLAWEQRGWPEWSIYKGVFKEALDNGMSLHGGNPDREVLMSVGRGGALSDEQLKDLKWDQDYSNTNRESLLDELVAAHCGMMGREAMTPLMTLQRLKDAHMARAMRQAKTKGEIAILIAGNGHTRKDRGVPLFIDQEDKVVSIAFVEVVRDETNMDAYPSFDAALYDYVWFTPRIDEIDPCDRFREQLQQMKSKMDKNRE
ncbi:ChaN family lipoprotein [Cohaesibacter celericrescens]|uniref:ChaN family lipoprotein n=1 Tax=Cohaesibacter celericrescens TaxID=2067669 RepID=UPI003566B243